MTDNAITLTESSSEVVESEASEPKTRREKLFGAGLALFAFSVMYALTSGPVAFLHKNIQASPFRDVIEVLYAPIVFVVKNDVEPLATVMKAYIGLFT